LTFPNTPPRKEELMAGFFAVGQNPSDNSLYPVIGWSVVEPDLIGANWEALAQRFATEPKGTPAMVLDRPLELAHFAGRYASMELLLAKATWRIVPSFWLKDKEDKTWTCFAYDLDAIERNQPGRVLALEILRQPPYKLDSPVIQAVYVCDLRAGYDPRTWQPEKPPTWEEFKEAWKNKDVAKPVKPEPQITGSRLQGGDLFTFLSRLVEHEGEVEQSTQRN
jgi:hypothetical protein